MTPTCPKCANTTFEIKEVAVRGANFRHNAIICAMCGAVIGTEEYFSLTYMLGKIGEKLGVRFDS